MKKPMVVSNRLYILFWVCLWLVGMGGTLLAREPVQAQASTSFYRGYNLGGGSLVIEGNTWEGKDAPMLQSNGTSFCNQTIKLVPTIDSIHAQMIRCSSWSNKLDVRINQLSPGNYTVFAYFWEDNTSQTYTVALQGQQVATITSGSAGHWARQGPYSVTISDGILNLTTSGGDANLSGIELWHVITPTPTIPPQGRGLRGDYFNTELLTEHVGSRLDPMINFDWGDTAPFNGVEKDTFSVRWTGEILAPESATYTFSAYIDNGARVWVNNQPVIDSWITASTREVSGKIALIAGQRYPIRIEFFEQWSGATMQLFWSSPTTAKQIIPAVVLFPANETVVPSITPSVTPSRIPPTTRPTLPMRPSTTSTRQATPTPQPSATATLGANGAILPLSYWESKLLNEAWINTYHSNLAEKQSLSRDSYQYYHLAPTIDGYTQMYLATGNKQYLDRILHYIQNTVKSASRRPDGYLGWPSVTRGGEIPLDESMYWRYVVRVLRIIRLDRSLWNNATYRSQYDQLLAFSEKNIWEKWYTRGTNNLYRSRTHMASHWAFIAMELAQLTTNSTKRAQYLAVNRKINSDIRNQIRRATWKDSRAYWWDDEWGKYNRPGQDTSHGGNGTVNFMYESYEQGWFWTRDDIMGLTLMIREVVWNGNLNDVRFANSFDGNFGPDKYGSIISGRCQDGNVKLGRFDANLQRVYERYEPRGCYYISYYGSMALNARILQYGTPAVMLADSPIKP